MNTDEHGSRQGLKHQDLTQRIVKVFFEVYNELGVGFLESVYEGAMAIALQDAGLVVQRQLPIEVMFRGREAGIFKADLVVEGTVIVELKAARAFDAAFAAQILNYLRATRIEVGLLMNFGPKPEFKRYLFDNDRKDLRGRTGTPGSLIDACPFGATDRTPSVRPHICVDPCSSVANGMSTND
jgi:GxxExxY protein